MQSIRNSITNHAPQANSYKRRWNLKTSYAPCPSVWELCFKCSFTLINKPIDFQVATPELWLLFFLLVTLLLSLLLLLGFWQAIAFIWIWMYWIIQFWQPFRFDSSLAMLIEIPQKNVNTTLLSLCILNMSCHAIRDMDVHNLAKLDTRKWWCCYEFIIKSPPVVTSYCGMGNFVWPFLAYSVHSLVKHILTELLSPFYPYHRTKPTMWKSQHFFVSSHWALLASRRISVRK